MPVTSPRVPDPEPTARELLVLRHGRADAATADFDRKLDSKGRRDAQRIGTFLLERDLVPDLVLASSAPRAATTAQLVARVTGLTPRQIERRRDFYLAEPGLLTQVIQGLGTNATEGPTRVLLVGHNPGLTQLAHSLARPGSGHTPPDLPTAGLVALRTERPWSGIEPDCASVVQCCRPAELPEDFPPARPGEPRRARPAYYFQQVGAMPYRLTDQGVEVLLVSSRSGKRWHIPKGIPEMGASDSETACREARKEGGVEGRLEEHALGSYAHEKWGGTCEVTVFPLEVRTQLPSGAWKQSWRTRRWVDVGDAAGEVEFEGLGQLFGKLAQRLDARRR